MPGSFEGMNAEFDSFAMLHASEQHVVWKARRYNRWWVLKGLPPEADTEANRSALRKEFEIMMQLPADGFPQAFSLEEVGDHGACIVMEYIEGVTLARWLDEKHPLHERCRIALRLMDIVARMHGRGIVSRDIKPSNIVISRLSGNPVLIDFDLADTCQHTAFKQPAGTAGYIAPEQAVGFMPDRRNDIYSLAKVVLEMEPPLLWRPVLRRCLKNIECRVPDAGQLRRRLILLGRLPRAVAMALCLGMALGFAAWLGQNRVETVTKIVTLPADTRVIDSLNNELAQLQDTLKNNLLANERRDKIIREESRVATGWVRQQWKKIETNPEATALNSDAALQAMVRITYGMDSIRKDLYRRLDKSEFVVVDADMNMTYNECYAQWRKKIEAQ